MPRHTTVEWLLRASVALAFVYPPVNALMEPAAWVGYFPPFVLSAAASAHIPEELLLHIFGVVELILAVFILFAKRVFWPAIIAAALLLAIVVLNLPQFQILFRDLSIALAALALALRSNGAVREAPPQAS